MLRVSLSCVEDFTLFRRPQIGAGSPLVCFRGHKQVYVPYGHLVKLFGALADLPSPKVLLEKGTTSVLARKEEINVPMNRKAR
jgi:hypothetical protein